MPRISDWFTPPALFQFGVFTFSAFVGVYGLKSAMPAAPFDGLRAATVLISFGAWFFAARQESEKRDATHDARQSQRKLDVLVRTQKQPALLPAVTDLKAISTAALREQVAEVVDRMRALETTYSTPLSSRLGPVRQHGSAADIAEGNDRAFRDYSAMRGWMQGEFRQRYHPLALALRDEMRRRLDEGPTEFFKRTAIDDGSCAGSSPLHDAALALEDLARRLPG